MRVSVRSLTDLSCVQGLTDTLYSKTNAASSRQRREFTPKTLEDLGVETSSDYNLTAPAVERALRPSSSNRSDQRSSSTARSSSGSTSSFTQPRPTSQPNFSTPLPNLDPWDTAEKVATAPPPPNDPGRGGGGAPTAPNTGWTVFPESSPAPAPRAAWGAAPTTKQPHAMNNNAYSSQNGGYQSHKRFLFCFIFICFLFSFSFNSRLPPLIRTNE